MYAHEYKWMLIKMKLGRKGNEEKTLLNNWEVMSRAQKIVLYLGRELEAQSFLDKKITLWHRGRFG